VDLMFVNDSMTCFLEQLDNHVNNYIRHKNINYVVVNTHERREVYKRPQLGNILLLRDRSRGKVT
jgi:hypothetical protein